VQSSTPIHAEIEAAAKAAFRNVLVAPLLVEGEPVGTMSAVNKQDADRFSPRDMEAYKYFADLAALVVRQRLREGILKRVLGGDRGEVPPELEGVTFDKDDVALMSVVEDIGKLAQERKDVVPLLKQLMGVLLQMSKRLAWR
jgi:GAF domain-containing protein